MIIKGVHTHNKKNRTLHSVRKTKINYYYEKTFYLKIARHYIMTGRAYA